LEQENIEKTDLSEPFVDAAKDIQGAFERHGTSTSKQKDFDPKNDVVFPQMRQIDAIESRRKDCACLMTGVFPMQ
jgi:hypothetical protein